jgi:dCTP deaminase
MLGQAAIYAAIARGVLDIEPFAANQLRAASYVLRLGHRFRRWISRIEPIDLWCADAAAGALENVHEATRLLIRPGEFVLAATQEKLRLGNDLAAVISPLSHVARFGLTVTGGADLINPGHGAGRPSALTLELANQNARPLVLAAGMPIAHLRLEPVVDGGTGSRTPSIYDGKDALESPMLYEEWRPMIGEEM